MPQIHKSRTQRVVFKNNIEYNLGYDPEDSANKETITLSTSLTNYPASGLVKAYVDACLVGLLDDRGSYDASGNIFPSSGGSGTAGAILKGDLWFISVGGTLGGTVVYPSYSLRALVDAPGQTASNWNIINLGLGFTPENSANKVISISAASTDTQYPSAKLVYDQLAGKQVSGTYSTDIHSNITALNAVSGTNTGDNATNSQYSGLAASKLDLHATADTALKADQLTTTRTIFGQNFNGSANVTGTATTTGLKPSVDSTAAIQLFKADGTTAVVTIDTTNSRQGVNKSVPETQFHVMSTATGNTRGVTIDNYATSAATIWRRANGTPASPTQVLTGEPLGFFAFRGLDNSGVFPATSSVYMQAMASENYTTTARGGYLQIATTPTGTTTSAVVMNIMGNGNISIGASITPTARLHLPAGTAAAGTASLLITPGTLTTTPVSGQIENNNQLYFTDSAAERRAIASSADTSMTADTTKIVEGYINLNIGGTNYKVMVTN